VVGGRPHRLGVTDVGDRPLVPEGQYRMEIYRDGSNADRHGGDHVREVEPVEGGRKLEVRLAPGGGWVARLSPLEAR